MFVIIVRGLASEHVYGPYATAARASAVAYATFGSSDGGDGFRWHVMTVEATE